MHAIKVFMFQNNNNNKARRQSKDDFKWKNSIHVKHEKVFLFIKVACADSHVNWVM